MKFGVFDHLDASGAPLSQLYQQRLLLCEAYDRLGFHAYHLAEHHATPLGMSPSPSVFLSAVAQRTERLLLGPLVYTLALYHPLRLAEEICMLDHLCGGRLQLGIGRGISPYEIAYFGADPKEAQAMYIEAWSIIRAALTSNTLTHEGRFFRYRDVPIQMKPVQQPHPPLWYGLGNLDAIPWCIEHRVNVVSNAPAHVVREAAERYRKAWTHAQPPVIGTTRMIVIANTDGQAMDIGRRAYRRWHASFMYLWRKHGGKPTFASYPDEFDAFVHAGQAAAGSAATVREQLAAQIKASSVNYVLGRFAFGDLAYEESLRTIETFAAEVMPALQEA